MRRLALAALCCVLAGCARLGGQPLQESQNTTIALVNDVDVAQTFEVPDGRVGAVDLLVATYGVPVRGTLSVTLARGADQLAQGEVDGADLRDNEWTKVPLDRVVPVAGGARFEVHWDGEPAVGVYANRPLPDVTPEDVAAGEALVNDPYGGGALVLDGEEQPGDLAFRVAGTGSLFDVVRATASDAVTALRRRPLANLGWALAVLGALALAVWGLTGRPARPGAN